MRTTIFLSLALLSFSALADGPAAQCKIVVRGGSCNFALGTLKLDREVYNLEVKDLTECIEQLSFKLEERAEAFQDTRICSEPNLKRVRARYVFKDTDGKKTRGIIRFE